MSSLTQYSPDQRVRALSYFFDLPTGEIEKLAEATGLSTDDILHRPYGEGRVHHGFSAVRTCSAQWRIEVLAPQHQGDWPFWRDVIKGFWVTGPLDHNPT